MGIVPTFILILDQCRPDIQKPSAVIFFSLFTMNKINQRIVNKCISYSHSYKLKKSSQPCGPGQADTVQDDSLFYEIIIFKAKPSLLYYLYIHISSFKINLIKI